MKIDWTKLKAAIAHDTKCIRELKQQGSRWTALQLKDQATLHHAIAAHARGHIHLSGRFLCNPRAMGLTKEFLPCSMRDGMTLDEQALFIQKELEQFFLKEENKAA